MDLSVLLTYSWHTFLNSYLLGSRHLRILRIIGCKLVLMNWALLLTKYRKLSSMLIMKNSELEIASSPIIESNTSKKLSGFCSKIVLISFRLCCLQLIKVLFQILNISKCLNLWLWNFTLFQNNIIFYMYQTFRLIISFAPYQTAYRDFLDILLINGTTIHQTHTKAYAYHLFITWCWNGLHNSENRFLWQSLQSFPWFCQIL